MVDNAGRIHAACRGALLSLAAQRAGMSGAVITGAVRDVDEIDALQFPVIARTSSALAARHRYVELAGTHAVIIDDVVISSGDYLVADRTAAVIIAQKIAERIAETADGIAEAEAAWAQRLAPRVR